MLVPTVCKLRSSLKGSNSMKIVSKETSNNFNVWTVERTINGRYVVRLHTDLRKKKTCLSFEQAVAGMKWLKRTARKLLNFLSTSSILSLSWSHALLILFTSVKINFRKGCFTMLNSYKYHNYKLYNAKYVGCLYSGSQSNLMYLTVIIEVNRL